MQTAFILEDLPDSLEWLSQALAEAFPGIFISTASSLAGAREWMLAAQPVDLALLDLGLPDGDGTEVIADICRRWPQTMCVVASIYDDDMHLFPALRAGAQGYLLKDQDTQQIAELLRGIAAGRPPLSPAIARRLLGYFRPSEQTLIEALTERETEVLSLIAKGLTLAEAARVLGISSHTVSGYVKDIYRKLNVSSRAEAALTARNLGLV